MPARVATGKYRGVKGVVAIIEQDGKILMQRRSEHIADPGTWVLPGGGVRTSEKPRETLVRVCAEELGITVCPHQEIGVMELPDYPCPVWHVLWKGKEVKLNGAGTTGIGWFTLDELLDLKPVRYQNELRSFLRSSTFFTTHEQPSPLALAVLPEQPETPSLRIDQMKVGALVERAQHGDHEAFGELYDLFANSIFRYVSFRVQPAIAEDLTADVFVKAWEKLDRYKGRKGTPFSSWLFRIAHNVVVDVYRSQKIFEEVNELIKDEDRWNDPTLKITQDLQCNLLRQALNTLSGRYREVLLLSFVSELSTMEVARAMRLNEGSVRILKHRALKKLEKLLPASMREELP